MGSIISDIKQRLSVGEALIYKTHPAIGIFGLVGVLIVPASTFIPNLSGKIIMASLFSILSLPMLLQFFIAYIYLDADKITSRNMIGYKKEILWEEILAIYTADWPGDLIILSGKKRMRLSYCYRDFLMLNAIISNFAREAMNPESVITAIRLHTGRTGVQFRKKKILVFFCIFISAFLIYACFFSNYGDGFRSYSTSEFIGLSVLLALVVFLNLTCFISRIYINDEAIVFYNTVGFRKKIRWQDIKAAYHCSLLGYERFVVTDDKTHIWLDESFAEYDLLQQLILKRSPNKIRRKPPVKRRQSKSSAAK